LLLTARGSRTWALIEFACLFCCPGNTLLSAPRAARKGWVGTIQIPEFLFLNLIFFCWHSYAHTMGYSRPRSYEGPCANIHGGHKIGARLLHSTVNNCGVLLRNTILM
jgi:hypothetical protein